MVEMAAIAVDSTLTELGSFDAKLQFDRQFVSPDFLRNPSYASRAWNVRTRRACDVARAFAESLRRHTNVDVRARRGPVYRLAQLVIHNAYFDGPLLQAWLEQMDLFFAGYMRLLFTLHRAAWVSDEDKTLTTPSDCKLRASCYYFGVPI